MNDLFEGFTGVRKVGNIGAHMEADPTSSSSIRRGTSPIEHVETMIEETTFAGTEKKQASELPRCADQGA